MLEQGGGGSTSPTQQHPASPLFTTQPSIHPTCTQPPPSTMAPTWMHRPNRTGRRWEAAPLLGLLTSQHGSDTNPITTMCTNPHPAYYRQPCLAQKPLDGCLPHSSKQKCHAHQRARKPACHTQSRGMDCMEVAWPYPSPVARHPTEGNPTAQRGLGPSSPCLSESSWHPSMTPQGGGCQCLSLYPPPPCPTQWAWSTSTTPALHPMG